MNSYKDPSGKRTFAELLAAVGELAGIRRVRFTTSHPRDFGRDIIEAIDRRSNAVRSRASAGAERIDRVLDAMQRLYTREQYMERIAWMKAAKREISITTDMIVGFPGETEADFEQTLALLDEVEYDSSFLLQVFAAPEYAVAATGRRDSGRREIAPAALSCRSSSGRSRGDATSGT